MHFPDGEAKFSGYTQKKKRKRKERTVGTISAEPFLFCWVSWERPKTSETDSKLNVREAQESWEQEVPAAKEEKQTKKLPYGSFAPL